MTTIFVNRYFYPDHSATSQILSDLAFGLGEKGNTICVITSRLSYGSQKKSLPPSETVDGIDVHRIWTTSFGHKTLIGRTIDYLTFYIAASWKLWRLAQPKDLIIAKTDPPMLSVLAAPIARARGAHLINWLQDIYPETAEALGFGTGRMFRALANSLRALRDRSLRASAMNVVIGERMAAFLVARGIPEQQICIIPNFADGIHIRPMQQDVTRKLRQAWGLESTFVVGYSGNLGHAHDYATLLDAIERIEAQQRDSANGTKQIAFLIVGGGALYNRFKEDTARRRLGSVRFEPLQPRERLSESLAAADAHIVSLKPELEGLIVPSKFYGIAAAGRPTIFVGDTDGEIARIIARCACGLVVPIGDGAALAQAICDLAQDPATCAAMGHRARRTLERIYEREIVVARWDELLAEVTGNNPDVGQTDSPAERRSPSVSARNAL